MISSIIKKIIPSSSLCSTLLPKDYYSLSILKQTKPSSLSLPFLSLFAFTTGFCYYKYKKKTALRCCGIIAYLGKEKMAIDVCTEGIQILQFRGYDSAGICTINDKGLFQITKQASDFFGNDQGNCIQKLLKEVPSRHSPSTIGIGHTRWATHGRKIALNAHPHLDYSGKIALVHNGIVDNYKDLKEFLKSKGIETVSDTDTEIIVQLIGYYYNKGLSFKESVTKTLNEHIAGSYALAIINKDHPDSIIVARNGSPLLVGKGKDFFIVSSDVCAFQKYTNNYFVIEAQGIVELNLDMKIETDKIKTSIYEDVRLTPKEGFDHFMLQEIMEQPDTINRAMNYGSRFQTKDNALTSVKLGGLEQYSDFLKNGSNLVMIACGTSYHACLFGANLIRLFNLFNTVQVIDAAEFTIDFLPKENPVIIFVSQSGETFDVLKCFDICQKKGSICVGIVNKIESTLAKSVLCGVFVNAGREISVASTKAFSGQVVALILVALFFKQIKNSSFIINLVYESSIIFLKELPDTLSSRLPDFNNQAKEIAEKLCEYSSVFLIGKGFGEAIVKEIALKIKEVSYIHAEAFNAGTFKHGAIAMIDSVKRTPVIVIVVKDNWLDDMISNYNQIKARNATVVLMTDCKEEIDTEGIDSIVHIPKSGLMSSLYAVFVGQLIAYYCSVIKGYNPDKPRQLSKEITTK